MSYLNINEPKVPLGGGTPKYSVSLVISKSDTITVQKIRARFRRHTKKASRNCRAAGSSCPLLRI